MKVEKMVEKSRMELDELYRDLRNSKKNKMEQNGMGKMHVPK